MKPDKWFEKTLKSFEKDPQFLLERKILDVTEEICAVMKKKDITRKELAERLGVSPAAITKILRGNSNFTLKTLLSLASALDLDLDVSFRERKKTSTASEIYRPHRQCLQNTSTDLQP